jgi:hypothetical protein
MIFAGASPQGAPSFEICPAFAPGTFFLASIQRARSMRAHDRKWGHLAEFEYYAHAPDDALARYLRVTPSTIRAWRSGKRPLPWWVPELLRLRQWECDDRMRRMGYVRLGVTKPGQEACKVYTLSTDVRRARALAQAAHESIVADDWGIKLA